MQLEQVGTPMGEDSDAVSLVARYRFDEATWAHAKPLEVHFEVARSRVRDLSSHLEAHPTVLCTPEHADVPPFDGRR